MVGHVLLHRSRSPAEQLRQVDGRELEVQIDGHRRPARGLLLEESQRGAEIYARLIETLGPKAGPRRLGIRANVDQAPTMGQLADLAARQGLAVSTLEYTVD